MTKKERYQYRVENSLCVVCGKPNDTDKRKCPKCNEKYKQYIKKYKMKHPDYQKKANEHYRELYRERVEKHICVCCGKPNDREGAMCIECAKKQCERNKADYYALKEMGICTVCGSNPTWGGQSRCAECAEKDNERHKQMYRTEYGEISRQRSKEYDHRIRAERKEQGLCPYCGRPKVEDDYITCEYCRAAERRYRAEKRRQKGIVPTYERWRYGLCTICSNHIEKGYKICKKCHDRLAGYNKNPSEKVLENRKRINKELHDTVFRKRSVSE